MGANRPIALDLYSGAGGLSLGLEQAGFDVVAAAEFDPIHALTHRYNFPTAPVLCADLGQTTADDVTAIAAKGWALSGRQGSLDIDAIVGGPPCQGFSVGGVRNPDDERNSQLLTFVELVTALQPKVFLLENVAGLLEPRFAELRHEAIGLLVDAGYTVSGLQGTVNAAKFGVPQSRRRVLVMGSRDGAVPSLTGDAASVCVADAIGGLPDIASYQRLLRSDEVTLRDADLVNLLAGPSVYGRLLAGVDRSDTDFSHPRKFDQTILTNSLRTVHTAKTAQRFRRTEQGSVERVSRLYRLDEDGISRTLRAGTSGDRGSHTSPRPIHPTKARVITVREAARLHGYPDWFRFNATNWHGHRQVGNSVPPPLAAAAGHMLMKALGLRAESPEGMGLRLGDPAWLRQNKTQAAVTLAEISAAEDTRLNQRLAS